MSLDTRKIDRASLWILLGMGFFVLLGGILQLRSHIYSPQRDLVATRERLIEEGFDVGGDESEDLASLQQQDSDGDGISDFDETYIHGTSVYLADSDSDGASDYDELIAGTNPNCAEGEGCTNTGDNSASGAGEEVSETLKEQFDTAQSLNDASFQNAANLSAADIRANLLSLGVSQEELDAVPDEELLQAYQDSLAQAETTVENSDVQAQAEQIATMTTDEKRVFLVQSGVTQSQVDALTDEQVEQTFNETLAEVLNDTGVDSAGVDDSADTVSDQSTDQAQ